MSDVISALLQGIGHQQRGNAALAEAIYADILVQEPEQPNALYLYGLLQLKDGRAAGAVRLLEQAARYRPDSDVWLNLARARLEMGDHSAALDAADEVLGMAGPSAEALYLRGTALNGLHHPEAALDALLDAAALEPGHAATWLNLGNAYADLDQMETAEHHICRAIDLDPSMVEAHASLGFVLCSQGRYATAMRACKAALDIAPRSPEAHWNLATALLLTGDYIAGFQEYEWHKRHRDFRGYYRDLPGHLWTGGPLDGQILLVDADQGIGDTIQLARYMPQLAASGARVLLACSTHLIPLLAAQPGLSGVVARNGSLPAYDCWVDQMSLPRLFGTTPGTIPSPAGYLAADRARQRRWAERLPDARIGLCWAGNPDHSNDRRRSMPIEAVQALVRPGMVSLQTGSRAHEAGALGLQDLSPYLTDFAETAAMIANLDLVITVDTAVAHLAGALGVPVWVMLPHAPDWRWLAGRDDTPWYSTMRLFRQKAPGDWNGVTGAISELLSVGAELNA
jgi:Flp pilus assembly protein TadD